MRKLNVFALLVLVTVFMFTSCQRDTMEEVTTTTEVASDETNAPTSLAEKVEGEITIFTEEMASKMIADKPEVIFDEEAAQSRNGEDEVVIAIAGQTKIQIKCGDNINSSNDHTNSSFNDGLYASRGYRSNLNGGDNVYYFDAPNDMLVTFAVSTYSNKRENLAMFLFEGDYDDWNHRATIRNVVASSSSSSIYRESLNNVALRGGRRYILVVDSAPYRGADYRLTVTCSTPNGGCEDFESYRLGNISPQNPSKWEKWDYNSKDGEVDGGNNQYLYMARDNYSSFQQDVVFKTGRVRTGRKTLSMDMWVYNGHSGYFNIQKQLRQEYGAEIYFYDRGRGEIKIANRSYNFSYTQNRWMGIELVYDFNNDRVTFKIDGRTIHSWAVSDSANTTRGSYQIEGVDFYVPQSDSEFFVDNVCFN